MQLTKPLATSAGLTKKQKDTLRGLVFHLIVGGFCLIMIYPILWLVSSSLKGPSEIWTTVTQLIPEQFAFQNYVDGWKGFGGITYATFFKNSFIVSGLGKIFSVTSSAIVAYCFARIRF
jgi:multiple sugar transport system permease protein